MKNPTRTPITRDSLLATASYNTRWFASVVAGTSMIGSAALAVDNLWNGTTNTDWNTASNWSLGRVPAFPNGDPSPNDYDDAIINITSPIATLSANAAANPRDIGIGSAGNSGRLDHTAGSISTGSGNWVYCGRDGGTGVYNLADTSVAGGGVTGYGQGSGSLNAGQIRVGLGNGGTGTFNINTTGTVSASSDFRVGIDGTPAVGVVNLDSGTVNLNSWLVVGGGGAEGNGTLNVNGGQITKTGGNHLILGDNGATGTLTMNGGTVSINNECWVGQNTGKGIVNLNAGTLTNNSWVAIGRANVASEGTVNQTGGTWNKTGGGHFIIGDNSKGTYNLSGTGALSINGEFWIGQGGSGNGTLTMSGGSITCNNWLAIGRENGTALVNMTGGTWTKTGGGTFIVGSSGPCTMNMSGGLVDVQSGLTWIGENGGATTATLNFSGTAEWRSTTMSVGQNTPNAILNLDGGTVRTQRFIGAREADDTGTSGGTGTINFNGTQIVATAANTANFISTTVDNAVIGAGGLRIDSNGFNLVAPKALSGTGGVVKTGAGTLTLSGLSSYAGNHTVSAGGLVLNAASTGTGSVTLADGTVFGVFAPIAGDQLTASAVTFGTSAATTLNLDLGDLNAFNNTASTLDVTGALAMNGTVTVNVSGQKFAVGDLPLVSYDATQVTGAGTFVLGTLPHGVVATLVNDPNYFGANLGAVYLDITSVAVPRWNGDQGADWTAANNWIDQVSNLASTYVDPNPVLFNDDAIGTTSVVLNSTVMPSDVKFDNSLLTYDLSGTGKISGATALTKSGSEALTISTANDYTGVTTLAGGTTNVATLTNGGVASPLGAASSAASNLVLAGGTLAYTGGAVTIDRGLSIAAENNTIASGLSLAADLTTSGPISATTGKLTKSGPGSLILTNPGANVLANGNGGETPQAFRFEEGALVLNTPGQTNTVTGWAAFGTTPSVAASLTLGSGATLTVNGRAQFALGTESNTSLTISGTSALQVNDAVQIGLGADSVANVVIENSGSLTKTGGWLSLGHSSSNATMTVRDSGTLSGNGDLNVGDVDSSTGTLNLEDNSVTTWSGGVFIGKNSTTGVLNMTEDASLTSGNTDVGGGGTSNGTLNIGGTASYTSNGRLQVGPGAGSTGNVVIAGSGSMHVNSYVSVGFNGHGDMTVMGSGSFSNTDDFSVNENGEGTVNVTLQDNATMSVVRTVFVGRNTGKIGVLTVTGAATLDQTDAGYSFIVGGSGTGTLNIQGTAAVSMVANSGLVLTNNAAGTATVNLDGGTLTTKRVTDAGGNSTFSFDGGVLRAGAGANQDFMNGLNSASVDGGGAFIDSNGQTIAIGQSLGDGGGNLTKQGAGTLLLNGINSYLGTTTVAAGTLGGTGSVGGELVVPAGSSIAPGSGGAGTFTADDTLGNGSSIGGTYVCEIAGGNSDQLVVGGDLAIQPGAVLDFNELSAPAALVFVIASYNSLSGTFTTVNDLPTGYTLDYNYLGGNQIALVRPPTAYESWAIGYGLDPFTDGAPGFDKDGDGQVNSVEFALGGSPVSGSDNAKIYSLAADSDVDGDATNELILTIAVRSGTPAFTGSPSPTATHDGYTYTIEGSTDLTTFATATTPTTAAVTTGLPAAPAGYEYRSFSLSGSNGFPSKGFQRVVVTP